MATQDRARRLYRNLAAAIGGFFTGGLAECLVMWPLNVYIVAHYQTWDGVLAWRLIKAFYFCEVALGVIFVVLGAALLGLNSRNTKGTFVLAAGLGILAFWPVIFAIALFTGDLYRR